VAHSLGLQHVTDVEVIEHGLVRVLLAVLGQPGQQRQPARDGGQVGRC